MNYPFRVAGFGAVTAADWLERARRTAANGVEVVACLPARVGTAAWQRHVIGGGGRVTFLAGRLKYGGGAHPAPFPSAIVVWSPTSVSFDLGA
jgi:site-specific DNA-methyltransferase (adenine-specific)